MSCYLINLWATIADIWPDKEVGEVYHPWGLINENRMLCFLRSVTSLNHMFAEIIAKCLRMLHVSIYFWILYYLYSNFRGNLLTLILVCRNIKLMVRYFWWKYYIFGFRYGSYYYCIGCNHSILFYFSGSPIVSIVRWKTK